jgi:regulator of nucleoside diphosphate kinase
MVCVVAFRKSPARLGVGPLIGTKEAAMKRPDITLTRRDLGDLDALLGSAVLDRLGRVGEFLLDELSRARIVEDGAASSSLVTMGATVRFRDDETGRVTEATLVYPREAGSRDHVVSVLTPVGAALLGLSPGQSIDYETLDGRRKRLTVLAVSAAQA